MDEKSRVHSMPPVVGADSRILVLGSMPGIASLAASRYYGHPRNHFWPILYRLHGDDTPDASYEDRLRYALSHGFALWDTIASCLREGSLDADIEDLVPSDIPGLLRTFPGIAVLVCNGAKSYDTLRRHYGDSAEVKARTVLKLPSTSPIPTRQHKGLEEKVEAWREALAPYLIL